MNAPEDQNGLREALARAIADAEATTMLVGTRIVISCETDTQARTIYDALESLLDVTSS